MQETPAGNASTAPEYPETEAAPYRMTAREQERIASLFDLIPQRGLAALDVGARDGYLSRGLADRFDRVTAVDLHAPVRPSSMVSWIVADGAKLPFPDGSFDLVLCAEVLEHIPGPQMRRVCAELARVARRYVVIGVPYDQDIRLGRTTCATCGRVNPPYGHVNRFDEGALEALFPSLEIRRVSYVGRSRERTNALSAWLTDLAGNPYGTYDQDESCVHCGSRLIPPSRRPFPGRAAGAAGDALRRCQRLFVAERPSWIHMLLAAPTAVRA